MIWKAADIYNVHDCLPAKYKVWTILGMEFGGDARKTVIIVHVLYGLETAGADSKSYWTEWM